MLQMSLFIVQKEEIISQPLLKFMQFFKEGTDTSQVQYYLKYEVSHNTLHYSTDKEKKFLDRVFPRRLTYGMDF